MYSNLRSIFLGKPSVVVFRPTNPSFRPFWWGLNRCAMNNNRGRYPPGIGAGRGGGMNLNPAFQSRVPQQHYVQRSLVQQQNQHQQQQQQYHQQQQQQQQWLRRGQLGGADSIVDEVEKTVQSEAVDSRCCLLLMYKLYTYACFCVSFYAMKF